MTPPDPVVVDRFRADCARLGIAPGLLALAVSGGADSMALLALATAAWPGKIIVATFDHRLRTANREEAAMVADVCGALGVPHRVLLLEAPIVGASLQARAREARYAALVGWTRDVAATALVTAHHADDQAETFLMRAARGSGIAGLAGIRRIQRRDGVTIARPLLEWRRAELRAIVRRAGLHFVDDPSNDDPRHDRTRFRRLLEANEWLDPPHLAEAARHLAEADADLAAITGWLCAERGKPARGGWVIDVAGLPREMRRRLARCAIEHVHAAAGGPDSAWHPGRNVEGLLDSLAGGKAATLAGVLVSVNGETWRFRAAPPRRSR